MRFIFRLFGIHAVLSIVQFLFMPAFFGLFPDNQIYQWSVGTLYVLLFWIIIYADMSIKGSDDSKYNRFSYTNGFTAGALTQSLAIILFFTGLIYGYPIDSINWFFAILRVWLVSYVVLFTNTNIDIRFLIPILILVFPILSGLSYIDGLRRRKHILAIINKAKLSREDSSKVNKILNKKK